MTNEDMKSLILGTALVVAGYAIYRQFKPAASAPAAGQGIAPGEPAPSPYTTLNDLLSGAVLDIGEWGGRNYVNEMADPLINGNNGKDSIVRGYW